MLSAVERDGATARLDEGTLTVSANVLSGENEPVYNLTVEGFHTYAVGYLNAQVHNTCPDLNDLERAELQRLDINPDSVRLTDDGVFELPIGFLRNPPTPDGVRVIENAARRNGATRVEISTGELNNADILEVILRRFEAGRPYFGFTITRTG